MKRIHLSPPDVGWEERRLLLEAFDSNWIAPLGPQVDAFEREFGDVVEAPRAVALSSGTAALHIALLVAGIRPGDVVITSTLTFAATANAIEYVRARSVFIDVAPQTWTMDPDLLAEELAAGNRTGAMGRAVIAVDLYGQCVDYGRIAPLCRERGVRLIEDAAEALGSSYDGRPAASLGDSAAVSFNGNKIITTSGGGMFVTHDPVEADRARYLASQARQPAWHYEHAEVGFNYRMSNLLAAVGRGQLRGLAQKVERRRAINRLYREELEGETGLSFMPEAPYGRSNCWLTCVLVEPSAFGASRDDIRHELEARNIETRPVWKPMHMQPAFRGRRVRGGAVAERLFRQGLCLPSGSSLTEGEQSAVITAIKATTRVGRGRRRVGKSVARRGG